MTISPYSGYDTEAPIEERRAQKSLMETARVNAKKSAPTESKILVPRESINLHNLPKNIKDVAHSLVRYGLVKAQHSQTWHEGAVFKSGIHQGEKRPDKTMDHYAIGLASRNPLTAVWSGGTLQYAKGILNGELFWTESVNELKTKIKGGWE